MNDSQPTPVLDTAPLLLTAENEAVIRDLIGTAPQVEVRAAHLYDRKGYLERDDFAGLQNPAYRKDRDDILIQVSLVLPGNWHMTWESDREGYDKVESIYEGIQAAQREAEVAARQAEVDRAEAALAAAQADLIAARTRAAVTGRG